MYRKISKVPQSNEVLTKTINDPTNGNAVSPLVDETDLTAWRTVPAPATAEEHVFDKITNYDNDQDLFRVRCHGSTPEQDTWESLSAI